MLQKVDVEQELFQGEPDRSHLLTLGFYWELFKRRVLYFLLPFLVIVIAGATLALLWPPTYYSSGKILITTQQIPTELVRPTVTTLANERIQVIQQRVLTRDNLSAIVSKFNLFPTRRSMMSSTEVTDLMRKSIVIQPVSLGVRPGTRDVATIAFTVGFYYEEARVATQVANELMTRILTEDLRDRTGRAVDTTRFLTREFQRLNDEYAAVEAKIAQMKRAQIGTTGDANGQQPGVAQLRAEYLAKSQIYSPKHPSMVTLKRQLDAFEKASEPTSVQSQVASTAPGGLDALEGQKDALQKNLEETSRKLSAARLGETLERDQQSEKFEVIEQPTEPQESFKPNRPKMLGISLALALAGGFGAAFVREIADRSIRRSADLTSVASANLIISIPYIATEAEQRRARRNLILMIVLSAIVVAGAAIAAILFMPPWDFVVAKARLLLSR